MILYFLYRQLYYYCPRQHLHLFLYFAAQNFLLVFLNLLQHHFDYWPHLLTLNCCCLSPAHLFTAAAIPAYSLFIPFSLLLLLLLHNSWLWVLKVLGYQCPFALPLTVFWFVYRLSTHPLPKLLSMMSGLLVRWLLLTSLPQFEQMQ